MSEHSWCRDLARDEAVRAAEDAAAVPAIQHRDLPEQVALLWASVGDLIGRVVRLEAEMDAGEDEEAAPAVCDPASPADGLRTERVTLEIVYDPRFWHEPSTWAWKSVLKGRTKTVRVVEETRGARLPDMVAWITAERDAARAEAERLRDRVAELEAAAKTAALLAEVRESEWRVASELAAEANAENAGVAAKQEPVAWGVLSAGEITQVSLLQWRDSSVSWSQRSGGTVVPLYAAPVAKSATTQPEPRGWLTAEEREAVSHFLRESENDAELFQHGGDAARVEALRSLLARETPPRVRRPQRSVAFPHQRDAEWIAAIREAGGEVEDG